MNGFWMIGLLLLWLVPGVVLLWERGVLDGFSRRTSNRKLALAAPFFLLLLTYAQKPQNQPEVTLPTRQGAMQQTEQSGDRMSAELKLSGVVPVCITNSVWSDWTNGTEYVPWLTVPVRKAVVKLELPFAFPVGTNVYSNIYVSASGVIGFDRPRGSVVPESLPCAYGTNGVFLALAWGDNMFKPGCGSRLRYGVESNSFCVMMEDVFSGTNVFSAKAELFDNGNVLLKYRGLPADHVVGLQNRLGGWQVATNGTFEVFCRYFGWADPEKIDTDGDSMSDYDEIYVYGTDPNIRNYAWLLGELSADGDADGDGVCNLAELVYGTDPHSAASVSNLEPESGELQLSITASKPTGGGFDTVLVVGDLQLPVWPGASVTYAVSVGIGETQTLRLVGREGSEQLAIDGSGFALLKDPENLFTVVSAPAGTSGLRAAAAAPAAGALPSITVPQFTFTPSGDLCTHGAVSVTLHSPNEDVVISGVSGSGEQTDSRTASAFFTLSTDPEQAYFSESSLTVNVGAAAGVKAISATNRVFAVHSCYDAPAEFIDGVEHMCRWCPVHHWDCCGSYCEYLDGHLENGAGDEGAEGFSVSADGFESLVIGGPANLFEVRLVPSDRKLPCPRCGCDRILSSRASADVVGGVTASPTVFREDGVTVVRGVAPSENFWDARVDVQLLPSGSFVQRRYTVTGAEVFPADPGYALTNAPYWVFNAGTGVFYSVQIRSLVHLPSGTVTVSISGRNARLHAFNRNTQTYDLIATSGFPWTQAVTAWRSAYVQSPTDLVDLRLECPDATDGEVTFAYQGSDSQGSAECSAIQRYDARRTGIYFKRKGELGYSDSLVVGKWENAFNLVLGAAQVKNDFLSCEGDTFRLVCFDEAQPDLPEVSVNLKSFDVGGMLCLANEIVKLARTSSGRFESDDLLMVPDSDDVYFGRTRFPGGDRLFWGKLFGEVQAEYSGQFRTVSVGAGIKTLTVKLVVPCVNGVPVISGLATKMETVAACFSQINVKVVVDPVVVSEEQPTGIDLTDGLDFGCYTNNATNVTSRVFLLADEARTLLDRYATVHNPNDVKIIFILDINDVWDFTANSKESFSGLAFPQVLSQEYGNTILISRSADPVAFAHEIGHLLLNTVNNDHSNNPWNLMFEYMAGVSETKSKRLTGSQATDMRQNGVFP